MTWARLSKTCHLPGGVESLPTVSKHDKAALLVCTPNATVVLKMETKVPEAAYQERAEHVKADEVDDGEVAPASVFLSGVVI